MGQALAGAPWGEWFTYGGVSLGLGSSRVCPALASWGPETRRVIGILTEQYALRRYSEELDRRRRDISGE